MPAKHPPIAFPDEKPKDELFALIKSLSKNEKRYVKVFSAHGTQQKSYLHLFDALDAESSYNEKEFVQKHATQSFTKFLPANKRFLKLAILRAMRSYHEQRNYRAEVETHLKNFHFLHDKGLYPFALKQLLEAKKIAQRRQLDLCILEINELESKYHIEHETNVTKLKTAIERLKTEQVAVLDQQQMEYLFTNNFHQVFIAYRQGQDQEVNRIVNQKRDALDLDSVLDLSQNYTFNSRLYFLRFRALLARGKKNFHEFRLMYQRIVALFKECGRTEGEDLKRYLKAISNYLTACHWIGEYEEFEDILEQFREMAKKAKTKDHRAEILQNLTLNEGLLYMNTGQWEAAKKLPPQIRSLFKTYALKVTKSLEITLSYNASVIWFFNEEWDHMKPWMDHTLRDANSGFMRNVIYATRILEVIYHFEKGNLDLVPFRKRSATRKMVHKVHRDLLREVEKISNAHAMGRLELLQRLVSFLEKAIRNPEPTVPNAGFTEMYYWAKSRAENISIIAASYQFSID